MNPFSKLAAPLVRRLRLMIARGVLLVVNDALKLQGLQVQLLADEVIDGVERFEDYGFTSHPHAGAEVIVVSVGGHRDHAVAIRVADRRYRPTGLQAGEVAVYSDEGDQVVLKRGNLMEVTTQTLVVNAAVKARFVTPRLECTGDIEDRCDDPDGRTMNGMRETYNEHVHVEHDGGSGPTDPPTQQM